MPGYTYYANTKYKMTKLLENIIIYILFKYTSSVHENPRNTLIKRNVVYTYPNTLLLSNYGKGHE